MYGKNRFFLGCHLKIACENLIKLCENFLYSKKNKNTNRGKITLLC